MVLSLNTIKKSKKAKVARKRVGRGNSSGMGTYCGRGLKGQKARSGVTGLKRLGMKQVLLRTPKKRGFNSQRPKNQVVNVAQINSFFKSGEKVTPKTLLEKGLIANIKLGVKVLGQGTLKIKELEFSKVKLSKNANEQIKKMDGKVKK